MKVLDRIAMAELVRFLATRLPVMSADRRDRHVIGRFSIQQQWTVRKRFYKRLEQFDLAALLRIPDQNWFELSGHLRLPRE